MATCANCGVTVAGRFCPRCGVPVEQPATGGLPENAASALCYALGLVTGVLFLVLEPYNRNRKIRFHAFQSVFGHVAVILIWLLVGALLPWRVAFFLGPVIGVGALALWLFVIWKAYQGETARVPLIGSLAEKQA